MPEIDNSEDKARLQAMIERIEELEGDPEAPALPDEVKSQLDAMKNEIGSLQDEMETIRQEVANAVREITQQTTSMITQVKELEAKEPADK